MEAGDLDPFDIDSGLAFGGMDPDSHTHGTLAIEQHGHQKSGRAALRAPHLPEVHQRGTDGGAGAELDFWIPHPYRHLMRGPPAKLLRIQHHSRAGPEFTAFDLVELLLSGGIVVGGSGQSRGTNQRDTPEAASAHDSVDAMVQDIVAIRQAEGRYNSDVGEKELEGYRRQFEQIRTDAVELTAGLVESQFNWRPNVNEWSIEECLAHLIMVGQVELQAIDDAVQQGHAQGLKGKGPFEYGSIDRFVVNLTEPPVKDPLPTLRRFTPLHGQPLTAILPTFDHVQSQILIQLARAEGLDLRRVKVATPISRWLKMSLGMMFAQIAAHERRHLEQARKVRAKLK